MTDKTEAAALARAHGLESGLIVAPYRPPERRLTQRITLLRHLKRHCSVSTLEARLRYSIMHPAGRIKELRRQGHCITTTRDPRQRFGCYHLSISGGQGGKDHA